MVGVGSSILRKPFLLTRRFSAGNTKSSNGGKKTEQDDGEVFRGLVLHSSELDSAEGLDGKTVIVIGSGASGVEAAETALARGAKKAVVIARDDKVR
jgi:NADPH-dependent glutamate synthase beta subunit-like oxidoreductase